MTQKYLITEYVSTAPGEPYRLLPFGTIVKDGERIEVTPELAAKFRLPHFKPPIKVGSHNDLTPAGGHIIGLEVREDGLYAIPEFNQSGTAAITAGAFRYHSPEIIWEGGGFEDPETGELIAGPLIVGDALLHTPHLGERAALYTITPRNAEYPGGKNDMSESTVNVPVSWLDRFFGNSQQNEPAPTPEPKPAVDVSEFEAKVQNLTAQIQEYQTTIQKMEAEREHRARVDAFAAQFKETVISDDSELFELLANVDAEKANALVTKFSALAEQVRVSNLTDSPGGNDETGGDATAKAEATIRKHMEDNKVSYNAAVASLVTTNPELFEGVTNE